MQAASLQDIEIRLTSSNDALCLPLLAQQRDEILVTGPSLASFADNISDFIILSQSGQPIACGGLRPIKEEAVPTVEIKRVYVAKEARGKTRGVADLLMYQLESRAMALGFRRVWLQTSKNMLAANRFYERHGYRFIANYGEFVGCAFTISFEKEFRDARQEDGGSPSEGASHVDPVSI